MNDEQPAQPLTDAELAQIREDYEGVDPYDSVPRLLAEVDRLRAENHGVTDENSALLRKLEEQYRRRAQSVNEITRIRNEATGTALGHLAKIKRLQSERDALVRKLGLDWGPDEFGDLDAATNGQQSCGDASIWSCALGNHCVCKKTKHGGRHECACGSWWFRDK